MLFDVVSLKGEHLSLKGEHLSMKGEHFSLKGEHTGVCVLSLQGKMVGLQGTGAGRAPPCVMNFGYVMLPAARRPVEDPER